jgi:hypothetical protein
MDVDVTGLVERPCADNGIDGVDSRGQAESWPDTDDGY